MLVPGAFKQDMLYMLLCRLQTPQSWLAHSWSLCRQELDRAFKTKCWLLRSLPARSHTPLLMPAPMHVQAGTSKRQAFILMTANHPRLFLSPQTHSSELFPCTTASCPSVMFSLHMQPQDGCRLSWCLFLFSWPCSLAHRVSHCEPQGHVT